MMNMKRRLRKRRGTDNRHQTKRNININNKREEKGRKRRGRRTYIGVFHVQSGRGRGGGG
jgi:hypothetical protein